MDGIYNEICDECGKTYSLKKSNNIEINDFFTSKVLHFCCIDHLDRWLSLRIVGLIISVFLGIFFSIAVIIYGRSNTEILYLLVAFLAPYTIRLFLKKEIKIGNQWYSEFLMFCIFILALVTVIYPIIKLVTEIKYYKDLKIYVNNNKGM